MVALVHPAPRHPAPRHPAPEHAALRTPAGRPELRLLRGGLDAPVVDRSGLIAGLAVVAVLFALAGLRISQGNPPSSASPAVASGSVAAADPVLGETTRVVQAGDTLWAIAETLAPGQDPRPIVDALADRNGGSALRVGEVVVVPAGLAAGSSASLPEPDTLAASPSQPAPDTIGAE